MSPPRVRYLVCYDICDDHRRTMLAHALEDFGRRVQYSVFECDLTETAYLRLRKKVLRAIDQDVDTVRIYRLCKPCVGGVQVLGIGPVSGYERVQVL